MKSISAEYLNEAATLMKMTSFFETKLEEQRIKMSMTPHFDPQIVFNYMSTNNRLYPESISKLFSMFMSNISEKELSYIYQLYSSDSKQQTYGEFIQMIQPKEMTYSKDDHEHDNNQIINDQLLQLQKFYRIEVQFFRQAEPMRLQLFEKHQENGRLFSSLVEDHKQIITLNGLSTFMKKQKFQFTSQDYSCLKKRIQCFDSQISSSQFIKSCPLLPFQVIISRNPTYKLIQPDTATFMNPEPYVQPQIIIKDEEPPIMENQTNYDFFMSGMKRQSSEQSYKPPLPISKIATEKVLPKSPQEGEVNNVANDTNLLDKFLKSAKGGKKISDNTATKNFFSQTQRKEQPQQLQQQQQQQQQLQQEQYDFLDEYITPNKSKPSPSKSGLIQPSFQLSQTLQQSTSNKKKIFIDEPSRIIIREKSLIDLRASQQNVIAKPKSKMYQSSKGSNDFDQ